LGTIALLGFLCLVAFQANATDLRGRIDGVHSYAPRPFPVYGARVDLVVYTPQGPVYLQTAFTGVDGMYYMAGVAPGSYTLQVNGILQFGLSVYAQPFQDIPPILLR
jgi:hypothetical protein